jgi:hypothetical protein
MNISKNLTKLTEKVFDNTLLFKINFIFFINEVLNLIQPNCLNHG